MFQLCKRSFTCVGVSLVFAVGLQVLESATNSAKEQDVIAPLIEVCDPGAFYETEHITIIDFDVDTEGVAVKARQLLNESYAPIGVAFSSETEGSTVVAYRYNCRGLSGRMCAANLKPSYGGVVRITFHKPDKPEQKATVTEFGVYLSAVEIDGTLIEAYDVDEQLIGTLKVNKHTLKRHTCFLGARSQQPIHFLRIVPVEDIDPDFAFDDMAFDAPKVVK